MSAERKPVMKPCPFCGGEAQLETTTEPDSACHCIGCTDCDFSLMNGPVGTGWWPSEESAIAAWNRRACAPAVVELVQAMADARAPEIVIEERFTAEREFAAYHAACRWCDERGISHGSMQAHRPIGLLVGDYTIAKWRNLNAQERRSLHGTMTGDFRNGPVLVRIRASFLDAQNEGAPA